MSSPDQPTVYLISGANRGIGLALVKALAFRPNVHVFAGARDPTGERAQKLQAFARENPGPGKVHVVKLLSADVDSNRAAVEEIRRTIGRLHVVVANAAILRNFASALEIQPEHMLEHFKVNALGPLVLFQAVWPLLQHSTQPKFVGMTAASASIEFGTALPLPYVAAGTSKAAMNYIVRKIWFEHENLVAFPMCPGPVDTDMVKPSSESSDNPGSSPASSDFRKSLKYQTVEFAADAILSEIDGATRESHENVWPTLLPDVEGGKLPW